ncbi:MAG: CGGC domain-containing protein [Synergistaceae bacterium]|nr:CGGC domain-containing protein [Synergistaceae bacterium]MBQ9903443.1 CGGC domain-containing protein [Synergistaceae bacterium]MBR0185694.1 CGGC domain-containing protein [Synergistaceae bacterium]
MPELVVIIQCDDVVKRCSGFLCMNDFYERTGKFEGYPDEVRYMSITCGGCCGNLLTPKLENLGMRLRKANINKEDVVIHFASCVCSDNSHRLPCPFMNRMKALLNRKGFNNIVLGTHVSQKAEAKRQAGIYKKWE